ncbi:MAG: fumarylacetoacetate hydrolase [Caulobacter sp.]|nr:fumarylacetoacetate hydrolase [Caulobacter sp.]
MPEHAFTLRPTPTVPVDGDKPFPVRRILCVGRNYAAHRAEMGGDDRDPPFFFAKPADAIVPPGRDVPYPSATGDLHHEIELVVAIGPDGIFGYAVGVDLTRRDLQAAAKAKGQPWDAAKGFDHSAPISAIRKLPTLGDVAIGLSVNGEVRQKARVGDMIWSVPEIVEEAGKLWDLQAGDLIFTGTPEGVGALQKGDLVEGSVEGVGSLSFEIV